MEENETSHLQQNDIDDVFIFQNVKLMQNHIGINDNEVGIRNQGTYAL